MAELEFFFNEVLTELDVIEKLAKPFIRTESEYVLPKFRTALVNIRDSKSDRTFLWEIPEEVPLRTRTSQGGYEQLHRKGSENIFAELTCAWGVANVKTTKKEPPRFRIKESPTTRVRLCRDSGLGVHQEIAMWRTEIGDEVSPGCHFHIQIRGQEKRHPFPRSVPVPRLPSIFATPFVVLDYVLGELFQNEWAMRVSEGTGQTKLWHSIQSDRLIRLFKWHKESILGGSGSPWVLLKSSKPQSDLFLRGQE